MKRVIARKNINTGEITGCTGTVNHITVDHVANTYERITLFDFSISHDEKKIKIVIYDPHDNLNRIEKTINVYYCAGYSLKVNKKSVSSSSMEALFRVLSDDLFYAYTENMLHHFFGADPFGILTA